MLDRDAAVLYDQQPDRAGSLRGILVAQAELRL
jgi:hypothetical protein